MPIFPDIHYKLGWRTIVSMKDQAQILDEIWTISNYEKPRIWLGIKLLSLVPPARPDTFFFRHLKSKKGTRASKQFGPKYFKIWWDKVCENVGIRGVDLYGGTKHSTVTALGQVMTPEQIQRGSTGHASDAFKRYMLPDVNEAIQVRQAVKQIQSGTAKQPLNILDLKK